MNQNSYSDYVKFKMQSYYLNFTEINTYNRILFNIPAFLDKRARAIADLIY